MTFVPPFIIHNAVSIGSDQTQIADYRRKYQEVITAISNDDFNVEDFKQLDTFNQSWEQ